MTLVARLGLRSAEVARLELEDIDWRAGEIIVRGKARRHDRLPMPSDVGEALTAYLCNARPAVSVRQVFLAGKAPTRAIRPDLVSDVTRRACDRAGVSRRSPPSAPCARLRAASARSHPGRGEPGPSAPGSGDDGHLCEGRSRLSSERGAALARCNTVSALAKSAEDYLSLRRSLGHDLAEAHRLLPRFVAYLDGIGATTVTIEAALAWAQEPSADPSTSVWPRRMTIARGFARHMAGIDATTEVPPLGLIPSRQRWRPPFIYSPDDIGALMAQARSMRWRLPAASHETVIGLLAAAGIGWARQSSWIEATLIGPRGCY